MVIEIVNIKSLFFMVKVKNIPEKKTVKVEPPCGKYTIENLKNGLKNGEVKCKPKRVPIVPAHLPKLPILIGAFGVVKSGKTNAFVNLIMEYWKHKSLNLLYCISPTYHSNASLQTLPFEKDGIFTDSSHSVQALHKIIGMIKEKNDDYKFEVEYKRIYRKFMKYGDNKLTFQEMHLLSKEDYRAPIKIPWPCPCIFIDDMTHTELMANTINNALSHLSLHHRHLDGVGVTIVQAFQTFKSGMPKVVRTNLGGIMLFPTCNLKELEEIHIEVGNNVTFETFKKLFFEATNVPHGFLFINKLEDDPCKQFGINFDRKFVIDPVEERRTLLGLDK